MGLTLRLTWISVGDNGVFWVTGLVIDRLVLNQGFKFTVFSRAGAVRCQVPDLAAGCLPKLAWTYSGDCGEGQRGTSGTAAGVFHINPPSASLSGLSELSVATCQWTETWPTNFSSFFSMHLASDQLAVNWAITEKELFAVLGGRGTIRSIVQSGPRFSYGRCREILRVGNSYN